MTSNNGKPYCSRPTPSSIKNKGDCDKLGYNWHVDYRRENGGYCSLN